jgi:diguanylate cyclase (GGDEF)-like protein/PAS domain S-box-containing protein
MSPTFDRNIILNMPLACALHQILLDDAGRPYDYVFIDVNKKLEEMTKVSADNIIGRRVSEVVPELLSDNFDWIGAYGKVALTGVSISFQQYSRELGRWFSVNAYSPEKGYFVTLFTDITKEKTDLDTASAGERKLRAYLDPAPFGILVVSRGGRLVEANSMACRLSGYSEGALRAISLQRLIDRDSRILALMFFKDLQNTGEAKCQLKVLTADGRLVWMSLSAKELPDGRYIIYCQDITPYKDMEEALVKSELLYRTFINASTDWVYLKDENLRYMIMNDALQAQYNLAYSDIIGKMDQELIPGDFSREAEATDREVLTTKSATMLEITIENIDRSYETAKFPVPIGSNKTGVGAYIRDVTEKKKQEDKLENLLEQTQAMFSEHDAVMLLIRPETGQIIDANPAAVSFYGYTKEELLSLNIDDIHCLQPDEAADNRWKKNEQKRKLYSFPHRLKNGDKRIVDIYSCPITYDNEKVLFSIIFDVTEREEAFDEIKYLSFHDHLTGLFNRRYFDSVLNLMNDERFMPLAVIMADVNGLKLINDSFGHAEGDALLKKAAEVITLGCRKDDISARIGGDEFVIILPKTDEDEARKIVERIRKLQSQVSIRQLGLSMSFGCAVKHDTASDIDLVVSEAENNMYKNKMHESASTRSRTVSIIMETLYEKCDGELAHSHRVSKITALLAGEMGLSAEQVRQASVAGLLHDIGKISIDDSILNKKGPFTKTEREEVEKHSESGWRILSNSDEYASLADYILYQHEFFNGEGYPRGLKGDVIPLISKIIAVSDAYDAMTIDRPYRKALSPEDALEELRRFSGTQFDPEIIGVFVDKVLRVGKLNE